MEMTSHLDFRMPCGCKLLANGGAQPSPTNILGIYQQIGPHHVPCPPRLRTPLSPHTSSSFLGANNTLVYGIP